MPIYELECVVCHNKVEKLFTCIMNFLTFDEYVAKVEAERAEHAKTKFAGFDSVDLTPIIYQGTLFCELCNGFLELVPSLPSMQPDKMWAGHMTEAGYVTSGSFLKRYRKQNNLERVDRSIYEEAQKKSANRHKEMVERNKQNTIKFLEKELASVEISPDGTTYKEQRDFIKARE